EPYLRLAPHTAQAFTNAPCGTRLLLSVFLARGSADDSWRGVTPCYPPFQNRLGYARSDDGSDSRPLLSAAVDCAADLHIANDPHLGCCHQLDRPTLAFLVPQRTGEDPVAMTVVREIVLLEPFPALLRVPSPAPVPQHLEDPVIHVHKGAFARRITVIHGPALDLLVQTLDHYSCRQAARVVDGFPDLGQERLDVLRRRLGQDL